MEQANSHQDNHEAGSGHSEERAQARLHHVILLLVLCIAFFFDLFFFTGIFGSDDGNYLDAALKIASGFKEYIPFDWQTRRLSVVFSAAFFSLFSDKTQLMAMSFIVFHLILIVLVYVLGRQAHSRRVSVMASGFTAICPLLVLFAGCILPDILEAIFLVSALLMAILANRARWSLPLYLAAGGCVGLAFSSKENGLVFLPIIGCAAVFPFGGSRIKQKITRLGGLGLGLLVYFIIEYFAMKAVFGQYVFRLGSMKAPGFGMELLDIIKSQGGMNPIARASYFHLMMYRELGINMTILFASLALYPLIQRKSWLVWGGGAWLLAYHIWGTLNLFNYLPFEMQPRYFTFVVPFAAICCAAVVDRAAEKIHDWLPRKPWKLRTLLTLLGQAIAVIAGVCLMYDAFVHVNMMSGRLYFAPLLDGTYKAMEFSLTNSKKPVVFSPLTGFRIAPWFYTRRHDEEFSQIYRPYSGVMTEEEFNKVTAGKGCDYLVSSNELKGDIPEWLKAPVVQAGQVNLHQEFIRALDQKSQRIKVTWVGCFYSYPSRMTYYERDYWKYLRRYDVKQNNDVVHLYQITPNPTPVAQ